MGITTTEPFKSLRIHLACQLNLYFVLLLYHVKVRWLVESAISMIFPLQESLCKVQVKNIALEMDTLIIYVWKPLYH